MYFSDILKLIFLTYLPIIIFMVSALMSIVKVIKNENKNKDQKHVERKRESERLKTNHPKDVLEKLKQSDKYTDFSNLSKSLENLFEDDKKHKNNKIDKKHETKAKNKSQQELVSVLKEVNKKNDEAKIENYISDTTTLDEIVKEEKSKDDFLDFDTEKVADIFVYKEIFDKPLSLR